MRSWAEGEAWFKDQLELARRDVGETLEHYQHSLFVLIERLELEGTVDLRGWKFST